MATKKSNNQTNNETMANGNFTKVICQNCGAEVLIPTHESVTVGKIVGEDSGLGTIVLPTKMKFTPGKDISTQEALLQLEEMAKLNPAMSTLFNKVAQTIENSGFVDVEGIVRRWIPSQCLHMVFNENGFHAELIHRGYDYSWDVTLNDLKRQCKLYKDKDVDGLSDRMRFYNQELVFDMAQQFRDELDTYMKQSRRFHHGRREYIKLKCWLNKGQGVHVSEFEKVLSPLNEAIQLIKSACNIEQLYRAAMNFNQIRKSICWRPEKPCHSFINVYKAVGAYYTIKDLIMFEGCQIKLDETGSTQAPYFLDTHHTRKFVTTQASLAALEERVQEIINNGGICWDGYLLLGLLREFLEYNAFDFEHTIQSWKEQSEARKQIRILNQSQRRHTFK